jgi:nitroreductase
MDILSQHRTIRKFTDKSVSKEILDSLITSSIRASTSGNMQLYSLILTQNSDVKDKLVPLHFNQPVALSAPVLITVCADFNRFSLWCLNNKANPGYDNFLSFLTTSIDALLVAQNLCIAAENIGLGICYLGTSTYNADEIINVLQMPKLTFPITTIAIGWPDEIPLKTDRLPIEAVIHSEVYHDYSASAINEFYAMKENLESSKKFVEENHKQHLSQVFTDVRYSKKDNEFFSEKILQTLRKQGFLNE